MSTSRTGQTRRPLARIHVIHEELSAGRYPNCSSLADMLEVSTKTIQRDLDFMRDEFGMPLEFDPSHNGYCYTAEVEAFPPLQIGIEELMSLFVARKVMVSMAGTASSPSSPDVRRLVSVRLGRGSQRHPYLRPPPDSRAGNSA